MGKTIRTKIMEVLAEASEPVDIQAIAEKTGSQVKSISEALSRLNKEELIENTEKGFWQVKDKGREELNRISEQEARSKKQEARSKKQEAKSLGKNHSNRLGTLAA